MVIVNNHLKIPLEELSFGYAKASGSGGQKVNKTNSQVQLRWNIYSSESLSKKQREIIEEKLTSKLTKDGDLIVSSETARSQYMNKEDCIKKLIAILDQALHIDKPRKKTKPTRGSKEKRIKDKKIKSETKNNRKKVKY